MQRQQRQEKLGGLARKMAYDKEVGARHRADGQCIATLFIHIQRRMPSRFEV